MGLGSFFKKALDPAGIFNSDKGGDTVITDNSQNIDAPVAIQNSGVSDATLVDVLNALTTNQSKILETAVQNNTEKNTATNLLSSFDYKKVVITGTVCIIVLYFLRKKKYV